MEFAFLSCATASFHTVDGGGDAAYRVRLGGFADRCFTYVFTSHLPHRLQDGDGDHTSLALSTSRCFRFPLPCGAAYAYQILPPLNRSDTTLIDAGLRRDRAVPPLATLLAIFETFRLFSFLLRHLLSFDPVVDH